MTLPTWEVDPPPKGNHNGWSVLERNAKGLHVIAMFLTEPQARLIAAAPRMARLLTGVRDDTDIAITHPALSAGIDAMLDVLGVT